MDMRHNIVLRSSNITAALSVGLRLSVPHSNVIRADPKYVLPLSVRYSVVADGPKSCRSPKLHAFWTEGAYNNDGSLFDLMLLNTSWNYTDLLYVHAKWRRRTETVVNWSFFQLSHGIGWWTDGRGFWLSLFSRHV